MEDGLQLLAWLLDLETRNDHLSVTPAGGWATGDYRPGFDQQPIEVAALADACARALRLTGESRWARGLARAVRWFLGDNDAHYSLYEPSTGGGCDGLLRAGRNENQGAEATLSWLLGLIEMRLADRATATRSEVPVDVRARTVLREAPSQSVIQEVCE